MEGYLGANRTKLGLKGGGLSGANLTWTERQSNQAGIESLSSLLLFDFFDVERQSNQAGIESLPAPHPVAPDTLAPIEPSWD